MRSMEVEIVLDLLHRVKQANTAVESVILMLTGESSGKPFIDTEDVEECLRQDGVAEQNLGEYFPPSPLLERWRLANSLEV